MNLTEVLDRRYTTKAYDAARTLLNGRAGLRHGDDAPPPEIPLGLTEIEAAR